MCGLFCNYFFMRHPWNTIWSTYVHYNRFFLDLGLSRRSGFSGLRSIVSQNENKNGLVFVFAVSKDLSLLIYVPTKTKPFSFLYFSYVHIQSNIDIRKRNHFRSRTCPTGAFQKRNLFTRMKSKYTHDDDKHQY